MTDRARSLLVIFGLLTLVWLALTLTGIQAELKAIREGLRVPRASYPYDGPVPQSPGAREPRDRWTL